MLTIRFDPIELILFNKTLLFLFLYSENIYPSEKLFPINNNQRPKTTSCLAPLMFYNWRRRNVNKTKLNRFKMHNNRWKSSIRIEFSFIDSLIFDVISSHIVLTSFYCLVFGWIRAFWDFFEIPNQCHLI